MSNEDLKEKMQNATKKYVEYNNKFIHYISRFSLSNNGQPMTYETAQKLSLMREELKKLGDEMDRSRIEYLQSKN